MGDVQVLRLNSMGAVMWARTYGNPTAFDAAFSIQTTPDGGFVVAGITNGYAVNGLIAGDFWVFKIDATGDIVWQHAYGGPGADYAISIAKTSDNGFVVAGWTNSFGAGGNDAWVLRLDNTGSVIWQKAYGGKGDDVAFSVGQTSDGSFIVAGSTNSSGAGGRDAWLFKLTSTGNVVWQKTYGGPGDDNAVSAEETTDGGFVLAATTSSFGNGNSDVWILKLNHNGSISKTCQSTGIMQDSNATVTDTNASATTTTTVPNDATVVATVTTAIATTTSETSQSQCISSKNQGGA
jgi:predicted secreted protein